MTDHCSPFCPFLACDRCPYQGGKGTLSVLSEDGAGLGRREQGSHPYSRLTQPTLTKDGLR